MHVKPALEEHGNATRLYSPIILCREWPALGRLVFLLLCSGIGTTSNGFFVASFFIEHSLKRIGNVFHACMGLADMMMTGIVMTISVVVLLSGQWDTYPVCQFLQFVTEAAMYCYSLFFLLVAADTYFRLCRKPAAYEVFLSIRIGLVTIMVFVISFIVAGVGTYMELDYDYCHRRHFGDHYFRNITNIIFHAIPLVLTFFGLVKASIQIRRRAHTKLNYRRSQQFERDHATTNLNIMAFVVHVSFWLPYLIIVYQFPATSDNKYYHAAWIGVMRSLLTSFLYSFLHRSFRRAFAHLFYYCCCKSSITHSFNYRHRRALEYKPATGDVRVHIMHQALNLNNTHRTASSSRETQEL